MQLSGLVEVRAIEPDGYVRLIEQQHNLITSYMKKALIKRLDGQTSSVTKMPAYMGVGSGTWIQRTYVQRTAWLAVNSTTQQQLAQHIVPTFTRRIPRVALYLKRTGTASGAKVWVTLESIASSVPSGIPIANGTSEVIDYDSISTAGESTYFTFRVPPTLVVGDTATNLYALVIHTSGYTYNAGVVQLDWGVDDTVPIGQKIYTWNGSAWTADANKTLIHGVVHLHTSDDTILFYELRLKDPVGAVPVGTLGNRFDLFIPAAETLEYRIAELGLATDTGASTICALYNTDIAKLANIALIINWTITLAVS